MKSPAVKHYVKKQLNSDLDTKGDRLHDKDPIGEDASNFLHTGKILDRVPDVPVFIQQLELA